MARTWREQRRIEEKIGEDWQRPKGMRQRTYQRLMDRLVDCEQRRDHEIVKFIQRIAKLN